MKVGPVRGLTTARDSTTPHPDDATSNYANFFFMDAEMFAHCLDACNVGCKIGAAHIYLDGSKAFGEIVIGLLQERLD
jgi:hypothetical protein